MNHPDPPFHGKPDSVMPGKYVEEILRADALRGAIINSANFSSIATDANGVIRIFNVGAERMLGYAAADVIGKLTPASISDPIEMMERATALSAELGTPIRAGFEALVFKAARGIDDIYELTYIRNDGGRLPAMVSVTALRDPGDAIIGYLLIGTDNTVRKQIEEERLRLDQRLRDQQFYTRSLIEANIDAIIATDPEGVITDVNRQMESLTGRTRDELIGAPFSGFFADPARAEAGIRLALAEGTVVDHELTALDREGKKTVVSCSARTLYARDHQLLGVFVAVRDITVSKHIDQILHKRNVDLQIAKMVAEKANLSKSDFLSRMSHELRSPLNAILGFAQLMESESPPPTPSQQGSIERILQAGWHLLNLINEILDLAKIESGKFSLSPEPVSLAEVFVECRAMVEGQAGKRSIRLEFPVLDGSCSIHADRTRLKQILLNLLSNAIKYNRDEGRVVVAFSRTDSGRVRISVQDTGDGLSLEMQDQLFQPFNRLGQEASGEEGTGIGLVVTKQLVEMMGGEIGVESTVGEGSLFWFELMLGNEAPSAARTDRPPRSEPARQAKRLGATRTLLYVEDNPANLSLVEQLVARRPELRLLTAVTGRLGLELARANLPELVLMDINLPDTSGIEVLRELRDDPATAHIPVVAISANATPHDIARGLKMGFLRYLTKPIRIAEFYAALDDALEFAERRQKPTGRGGAPP